MTRQEANLKLVELLRNEILTYPDLRFSQILCNLKFISETIVPSVVVGSVCTAYSWIDEYYVESETILERVKSYLKKRERFNKENGFISIALIRFTFFMAIGFIVTHFVMKLL